MLFMDKNDLIWFVEICLMHILQIIGPPFIKEETGEITFYHNDKTWHENKSFHFPEKPQRRGKKSVVFIIQQIHKFRSRESSGWAKVRTTNKQSCASIPDQMTCLKITNQKTWACLPGPWKQLQKTKGRTVLLTCSLLLDTEQLQVSIISAVADWIKEKQMSHVGSIYRDGPQVGAGPLQAVVLPH